MLLRLPTVGRIGNPYRGLYPNRLASFGGSKGSYHLELNSGLRFVCTAREIASFPNMPKLGSDFAELFPGRTPHDVEAMDQGDYGAVLFIIQLARLVRYGKAF